MMNIKFSFLVIFLPFVFMYCITAQDGKLIPIQKEKFNINKAKEDTVGYAQAVKVGNTIYISGSTGSGNMPDALKMAYGKIEKSLKNYNIGFECIVKENLYTTVIDSVIKYKNIRKNYYNKDYPAATWVEVRRLSSLKQTVEIEVIAIMPETKK
jgi:2-iminobutanoate/2-iminopropanoate deaminase